MPIECSVYSTHISVCLDSLTEFVCFGIWNGISRKQDYHSTHAYVMKIYIAWCYGHLILIRSSQLAYRSIRLIRCVCAQRLAFALRSQPSTWTCKKDPVLKPLNVTSVSLVHQIDGSLTVRSYFDAFFSREFHKLKQQQKKSLLKVSN